MEFQRIYEYYESVCSLEICQWCGEPCFAGAEVSLGVYLLQISRPSNGQRKNQRSSVAFASVGMPR
jgi:hypothetical protein